ncbi:hypothetical protein EAO73_13905 [Streptomyces sp. col6]|nr:hypothetical protein EAO73_13905 [Streptomyces sp. col6]
MRSAGPQDPPRRGRRCGAPGGRRPELCGAGRRAPPRCHGKTGNRKYRRLLWRRGIKMVIARRVTRVSGPG